MTADFYTGKHRREGTPGTPGTQGTQGTPGTPGTPGTQGTPGTLGVPPQGKPAWSKAGRLLAAQIVVIAKEPYPGRVKTRLTPPFTPVQAAELAAASLSDTLAAV
ncbi:MAG: hypothetical protein ACRDPF_11860, partial [Streptosporangiaceae bacterium]